MRSTPGRWARRIGVPAAAMVAVALVGAPAFAATSTPSNPKPPAGCVVIGKPGQPDKGMVTLPDPGKGCVICIIKKHPGDGAEQGTTSTGKPGQCPVCPPPGKPGTTAAGEGTGTVTQPGKKCVICVIIKPGQPNGPVTKSAPVTTQPAPGKPVKCDPLPVQK
ncbi:hypothetical protein [Kutzneria sp. 744]|uniref:hypothetical protein n=1 Tax=Kutzneria sp. (strain 744) TaxID=345341 RepID=UPI0003EEC29A|nr:hypothetical protein [Kutzneria sp. 744]EWM19064.1 hypothetical protein KUTG_09368 [Kutzneria sp. 744]